MQNVTTLAGLCFLIVAVIGLTGGGWRTSEYWVGISLVGVLLAIALAVPPSGSCVAATTARDCSDLVCVIDIQRCREPHDRSGKG